MFFAVQSGKPITECFCLSTPALTHLKATYVPNVKMSIDEGQNGTEFKLR